MERPKLFAFVLMPFSSDFDDVYRLGIQETASALDVVAERVDEQIYTESILERIYRQIDAADFVIADMTGRNPNVFYEVGYTHAREKLCTLLTKDAADIPFDLKHHRHIVYDGSIQKLREHLSAEIAWVREEIDRRKTALFDVKFEHDDGMLESTDWRIQGSFNLTVDLFNRTNKRSPEIEAMYLHSLNNWTFTQEGTVCASSVVDEATGEVRHFIKPPISRLSPGAWAQVKLSGKRDLWTKWSGAKREETYRAKGTLRFDIVTSEGAYKFSKPIDIGFDDIPF